MKYLLLSPNKESFRGFIESPPVGLGYLATALRKIGHEVEIIDCIVERWSNEQTVKYINDTKPDVVGVNLFSSGLSSVKELLVDIRKLSYHPLILLGGPHCSGDPTHTMNFYPEVDYGFKGEAEIPIQEFDEFLKGKRIEGDVRGLIWRQGDKVISNEIVEHLNIEDFGLPAWDLIDPRKYFNHMNVGQNTSPIHFSRGCPFACTFCVHSGQRVRRRSIPHIWSELEYLNKNYGVNKFIINDEGFTMIPNFVKEFCKYSISKGNPFSFQPTGMRLNRMDDEMLDLAKQARFELFFGVGIESGVPRVRQELMNKTLTQEELVRGLRLMKKHGYHPLGYFIVGFPGETRKELIQSVKFACWARNRGLLWGANFTPFLPMPGSVATMKLIADGELPKDYDYRKINLTVVAYAPKGMTIKELDYLRRWAVWKFNTHPRIFWRYINDWQRFIRAVVTFLRIYANWLLPKGMRRRE